MWPFKLAKRFPRGRTPSPPLVLQTLRGGEQSDNVDPDATQEESTLLGSEQIHSRAFSEEEEDEDHAQQVLSWKTLPWWKRPSPFWVIFGVPISVIGHSILLAPKVALYTSLVCRVHRPGYDMNNPPLAFSLVNLTASDTNDTQVNPIFVYFPRNNADALSLPDILNDHDIQQKCASDSVVQATVARVHAVLATITGILSCLTTGWWSSLSDRSGRRIVILASVFGVFVTDVVHLMTAWFTDVLPGGYWFPLVGFFIDGLCGGHSTGTAVVHTYLADTTGASARSHYFSLLLGLIFTGVAVGPILGGLLIRSTGDVLSTFYLALILHGIYTVFIFFFLPESLTQARARGARLRRRQEKADRAPNNYVLGVLKNCTQFFSPLAIFLPKQSLDTDSFRRKDWSLFFIAISYGLVSSAMGSHSYGFQYAAAQFEWTPEITSYFVSCVAITRAIFLAVILPVVIRYLNPTPIHPSNPSERTVRASTSSDPSSLSGSSYPGKRLPTSHSIAFDLALARSSLAIDVVASLAIVVAKDGLTYTLAGMLGSLGTGFSPAIHALALDIYTNITPGARGEVGKLYGALSVVHALTSQMISPGLYGLVYSNTVATFPQAFLVVSLGTITLALVFFLPVRIPTRLAHGESTWDESVEVLENMGIIQEGVIGE